MVSRAVYENLLKLARAGRRRDKQAYDAVNFINRSLNEVLASRADEITALKGQVEALETANLAMRQTQEQAILKSLQAQERQGELEADKTRLGMERHVVVKALRAVVEAL
jgi:hypothetical protein